jgi:hypothetical protein
MMPKLIKILGIVSTVFVIGMVILVIVVVSYRNYIPGWRDFKHETTKNYSFIHNIKCSSSTPVGLSINVYIRKEVEEASIEDAYDYIKEYVLSEQEIMELHNYQYRKWQSNFSSLCIFFCFNDYDPYYYRFDSNNTGNGFSIWHMERHTSS